MRFKKEFQVTHGRHFHKRPSSPAVPAYKPTMADMSTMSPEMRQLYLVKRKRIGVLATQRWGKSLPKFNSPETKQQLAEFATEITPECGIPEINFGEDGIARHIQTFFSEQRRYQKNKKTQTPRKTETELKEERKRQKVEDSELEFVVKKIKKQKVEQCASGEVTPSSAGSSADVSSVDGGDTESVHEDENSASDHESPPSTQANSKVESVEEEAWQSNLAMNQAIVKGVFGKLLKRDDITHVLKKKFAVQQKMITNLKPTELLNVLARKLVRHNYCKLKGEGKNKEDIIVLKEISFF